MILKYIGPDHFFDFHPWIGIGVETDR